MAFSILFYTSLVICVLGLVFRVYTWFSIKVGYNARGFTSGDRAFQAFRGIISVVFSTAFFTLIRIFFMDILFQRRILKESLIRWLMHMLIFWGFILLLLMHAMDEIISEAVFPDYYSTVNPFYFLRDLFGLLIIIGLFIAVYRRFIKKVPRLRSNAMDIYAIILLAAIMISGILLEGSKISSHTVFTRMVEDYSDVDGEEELAALESLWTREFGLASPNVFAPFDEEVLALGRETHEMNCEACHSSAKWGFAGYASAKIIGPASLSLDSSGIVGLLYYIHVIACFLGLAYLPFSKMFHVFAVPVSLLSNAIPGGREFSEANSVTMQAMELDACTHCGTCSLFCSAMMAYEAVGNEYILPSEKMLLLKGMAAGKHLNEDQMRAVQEGVYLCTNCDRCTVVCPSGINLKELWISVREEIIQKGRPEPLMLSQMSLVRGLNRNRLSDEIYSKPLDRARSAVAGRFRPLMNREQFISFPVNKEERESFSMVDSTFSSCFGCQNCTTVCPVVENYENPQEKLGLLPHQIMCCLALGLDEMASGAAMIWDCVTCYQCQEHCPQNVKVTDILYDLKNRAVLNSKQRGN